ncbi:efflux RND transporter permease subunit [Ignavibacterium sp.]|uniref:efflux RND transporter permease subunit n=1 Tax=Ignavibacterium sp. TaxID=2651167 RepID=UPI00307DD876
MPLPSASIKRPVTVAMFYIAIALLGMYAFSKIGVDLLPDIHVPHLLIQTSYPKASSEEIEQLITQPLEATAGTLTGIKNIKSVSREGFSVISLEFAWGTNMDFAILSLREKLDNARFILPREASSPTIIRVDPSATPIMTLVLSYNKSFNPKLAAASVSENEIRDLLNLKEAARIILKRRFEQIDGVAQAVITGGLDREILIEADLKKLAAFNLTFEEIISALKSANISLPAGSIMKGLFRYSLRTIGEFRNIDEIGKTVLRRNSDGSVLYLKDIAFLKESIKERTGLTRFNGNEAIGILIYKEPNANTIEVSNQIQKSIESMKVEYPSFDINIFSDYSKFIGSAFQNVKQEIYFGGFLAFIVLFFFLKSIKNIFIIGITIPASLLLTILLMYLFNIRFNIVSLGGIAVGIGMLLDNSIIIIENITRFREQGCSTRQATLLGTNEVSMPIFASTLTTIAVFLPLIFIKGIAGELFKDQSYAIIISLSSSILVALTLIPMLSSREKIKLNSKLIDLNNDFILIEKQTKNNFFHKILFWLKFPFIFLIKALRHFLLFLFSHISKSIKILLNTFFYRVDSFMSKVVEKYDALLLWSLNNKKKVLFVLFILILVTLYVFINIKKEFIPESAEDEFNIEIRYSDGISLEGNSYLTREIERALLKIKGVKAVISNIGRVNEFDVLNRDQLSINKTNLIVKLNSSEEFYRIRDEVTEILDKTKNINYSLKHTQTAYNLVINPAESDIAIAIKNNDLDEAFKKGIELLNNIKARKINGISDLRLAVAKGEPEYRIIINRDKVTAYGINLADAATQIVNIVKGSEATTLTDFDKKITIRLRALENQRSDLTHILESEVTSGKFKVKVKELVDFYLEQGFNEIWRENQARTIYLYARVNEISISEAITALEEIIQFIPKKHGEIITLSGLNQEIIDSLSDLYVALLIAVLLMYMVLAAEFESFLFALIIIFSIPMGLIGSLIFLYLLGESLNIISVLGLIILVGIADNDAVVKVEFIMRKRKEGLDLINAILEAGRDRFRPIVMNSLTVIFSLIPIIFSIGLPQSGNLISNDAATQLRISLSIALAGGLIFSTILTLIFIPVLYSYLEKYSKKKFS